LQPGAQPQQVGEPAEWDVRGGGAVAGGMVLRGGQNTLARRTEPPTTPCYCGNSCPPAFLTTHFRRPHCGYKSFGPLELGLLLLLYTEKNFLTLDIFKKNIYIVQKQGNVQKMATICN